MKKEVERLREEIEALVTEAYQQFPLRVSLPFTCISTEQSFGHLAIHSALMQVFPQPN